MDQQIITKKIVLEGSGDKTSEGEVTIEVFASSQRLFSAVKKGLIGFVISSALVVVPLLHFILPPIGLLITFIITANTYARKSIIVEGKGQCPNCDAAFRIFKRNDSFPFFDTCEGCHRQIRITKA